MCPKVLPNLLIVLERIAERHEGLFHIQERKKHQNLSEIILKIKGKF